HGTTKHHAHIAEKVVLYRFHFLGTRDLSRYFHLLYLLFANNGQKDFLQGRLFFHIFHLSRWKQLFELHERAAGDDRALMENGNAISKLFCLFQVLRGQEDGSTTKS